MRERIHQATETNCSCERAVQEVGNCQKFYSIFGTSSAKFAAKHFLEVLNIL